MSDSWQVIYGLIRSGRKREAIKALLPLIEADPQNPAGWWLLAHAAPNRHLARQALNRFLALRPGDERALKLLEKIEGHDEPPVSLAELLAEADRLSPEEISASESPIPDEADGYWQGFAEKPKRAALRETTGLYKLFIEGVAVLGVLLVIGAFIMVNVRESTPPSAEVVVATPIDTGAGYVECGVDEPGVWSRVNDNLNIGSTLPDDVLGRGTLDFGEQVEGEFTGAADRYSYQFEGEAGQWVNILLWGMEYGTNPIAEVYKPDNTQFAYCDDYAADNSNVGMLIELPEDGTYTIVARRANTNTGRYGIVANLVGE